MTVLAESGVAWRLWEPYRAYHEAVVATNDIDPCYPTIREFAACKGWTGDQLDRAGLLHLAYYHMGSSAYVLPIHLDQGVPIRKLPVGIPTGLNRRGFRNPKALMHHLISLDETLAEYGTVRNWLGGQTFEGIAAKAREVWGNGRWGGLKYAEMLQKSSGWSVFASDMEIVGSSGPAAGLEILAPRGMAISEELAWTLVSDLNACGISADPETVETTLCDFHAVVTGRCYVGFNIDDQLGELVNSSKRGLVNHHELVPIWTARERVFPARYLGERMAASGQGWWGVDQARKRFFVDYGEIVLR